MDKSPHNHTPSIGAGSTDISERTPSLAFTNIPSIISSVHNRPAYQRLTSDQEEDISYKGAASHYKQEHGEDVVHGLRINFPDHDENQLTFGATVSYESSPNPPGSADRPFSPSSAWSNRRSYRGLDDTPETADISSHSRTPSTPWTPFSADSEAKTLRRPGSITRGSLGPPRPPDEPACRTKRHFYQGRGNWLSITILILSVYSTILSAIWLGLSLAKPRYGKHVVDNGPLAPSTASLLCAAFAKTIELSFVTVFVAFLGQVLSSRAIVSNSRGISISEMQMRYWIQQPGTLITHWQAVHYAAYSFLGAIALVAAFMAMLYTTASDALVAPKLKFGSVEHQVMYSHVRTIFGNQTYQIEHCKTPISENADPWYWGPTCIAIEHSGQAYHNYAQYLDNWTDFIKGRSGSSKLSERPIPVAMLYDNTTVKGSFIEEVNMPAVSEKFGRIVNNITIAMPLTAVFGAARNPINNILQPQDLEGLGEYYVHASVPSPAINVLCAQLSTDELKPMILDLWPGFNGTKPNATNYPTGYDIPLRPSWLNQTSVDDLFGFGEKYNRRHPVFPKIPLAFNTIHNITDLESDSLYVLGTSNTSEHMLCSLRASLTPACSTEYHASMSGGLLTTRCEDPSDPMAYKYSQPLATSGLTNVNWTLIANQWSLTMSLNAGIIDGQASNARLLTQLMPTTRALNISQPSIAEALAVMAGCTLLMAGIDAPVTHHWNYSSPVSFSPTEPAYQAFNATVRSQDYSSGGTQRWQGIFYIVLVAIFLTNVFCLGYFLVHDGLVTDFVEPQNLFALAMNSRPSWLLDGACGAGPKGDMLGEKWRIGLDRLRDHFFIEGMRERVFREGGGDGQGLQSGGIKRRKWGWWKGGRAKEPREGESSVVEMFDLLGARSRSSLL